MQYIIYLLYQQSESHCHVVLVVMNKHGTIPGCFFFILVIGVTQVQLVCFVHLVLNFEKFTTWHQMFSAVSTFRAVNKTWYTNFSQIP